ncbi:MAG: cyclic nucleotide-binding domain-containing protein [Proteobacteria bacterium]|nr:MAG: cyclic nucleotide-binding domain-containing protein [Pseudomonadota bacterium]
MPVTDLVLVVMGLLTVAMLAASLCRNLPIPYTVFLVLIGMLLSMLTRDIPALSALHEFRLTPDLVFFIFLPALIFESALNLDARQLLKDIAPIFALAAPALLISTVIIGVGVWLYTDLDLILALVFGALIAATDPVAVVALFKELGAPARLTTLVEGESLFNDATAIVTFKVLLGIALAGSFTSGDVGRGIVEFFQVFFGGVIVGTIIGFGIAELMRRIRGSEIAILVMSLVMAYASFVIAEHLLHVSGVMAAVSAAVAMGIYAVTRIPQGALRSIRETWEVIALVCNSLLFLMIGLSVDLGVLVESLDGILVAALLVLIARAASIYTLIPAMTRLFALPHVNMGERHIMWWGGLKGGLAIAIVLSIPESLAGRQTLVELTLGVVLFTLLINAPSIRPLIKRFGLDRMSDEELAELRRGLHDAQEHANAVVDRLAAADLLTTENKASINESLVGIFEKESPHSGAGRHLRRAYMEALQLETEELDDLYRLGLIQEYTYLDLRARLRRDRDAWASAPDDASALTDKPPSNPFLRVERAALRWVRERNLLTWFLARFQRARLSQGVQRDIAGILCGDAVMTALPLRAGLEQADVGKVIALYSERVQRKRKRVAEIRSDFPEFFTSLEQRLAQAAALASARNHAAASFHHGDIGAKAFTHIERLLDAAITELPPVGSPDVALSAAELIERVPLFGGFSSDVIERLADRAQTITFLSGDVVIGQNEKGNALYILMRGTVNVMREDNGQQSRVASLSQGEFFGEAALLGDETRTATVTAATSLTLLRLTRRSVLSLADKHPEIAARLNQAYADRH